MAVPEDTPQFVDLKGTSSVNPIIIDTITNDLGFNHMMPVQAATLQELLPPNRSDCLVQAKTGTGKTMAFLLPAVQNMLTQNRPKQQRGVSLLVISPTRELAMQIEREAARLLQRFSEYKVCIAIGGTNKNSESSRLRRGCDVLIATPGRLLDHMSDGEIQPLMRHVDTLVLDEADRLLDMGFMPDLKKIVAGLPDKQQTNRQGMLFSATIPPRVQEVAGIVLAPGYKFISTIPEGEVNTHERVPQVLIVAPTFSLTAAAMVGAIRDEMKVVAGLEGNPSFKAIIFSPTAAIADFYGRILAPLSDMPAVSVLHSRISQTKRTKVTNEFRLAKAAVLVTTDVIARGMDFPDVSSVFQVGLPADKETYIHRLGRTARAGAGGRGIFIVAEPETWFPKWTLKEINMQYQEPNFSAAAEVTTIAASMDEELMAKTYKAWLGYYKNFLKPMKWTSEKLVEEGNIYASEGLQAPETPAIEKNVVGKMGLKGVKGLRVVPGVPRGGRGGGGRPRQNRDGEAHGQGRGQGGGGGGGRRRGGGGGGNRG
ncbi:DEAD/DEAH box helicase domain-containing protein [Sarocladium implicatum]|nr:DEAD/DEAH box helicase domain-containing protein [Sarocladium implicatum]